ncbi:MAG: hypothetical protein DMG20_08535 [Acidobacteria bacterium]|nr:MAG: hypothetical protein DMG20_08535 [Acidobacteriota bacterium]
MRTWDSQHRLSVRALSADLSQREISPAEANYWWRKNDPAGALLNNLMFLFVVVPIVLVLKSFYALSFVVFAMMVPYGLFLRRLAIYAVRHHLENHPEEWEKFEESGIISSGSGVC